MTTEHTDEELAPIKASRVAGFLAQYDSPADVMHAAEKVRDAGYTKWDVHSPFPVHGMDGAMGLKSTPMGWISLAGGLTGGSLALLMQWWMNGYDYPLNIGGKPAFAPQAFVPITFELTILLTTFATLFGMFGLNRLPQLYHWVFAGKSFGRATDDLFFISIDAEDPKFDRESTKKLLDKTHPASLEEVEEEVIVAGGGALRENVGLTVEAIAGISSPFQEKKKADEVVAKEEPPAAPEPAPAKSTPPPAEEPKVETPKVEEPKVETPKVEEPKTEEPKVEDPKTEAKVEETKVSDETLSASDEVKSEETKTDATKDEPEAPKGGTEKP